MKIKFDEKNHVYTIGNKEVQSVTQFLETLFPGKYDNVDKTILENKATYGTEVHKYIEVIEKKQCKKPLMYLRRYFKPDFYQETSIKEYLELKAKNNIIVLDNEKVVSYKDKYCGTLDMRAKVNGELAIIDIKTTYELDQPYVTWQTSMYELAYKYTFNDTKEYKHYVLWLPKGRMGRLIELGKIDEEIIKGMFD